MKLIPVRQSVSQPSNSSVSYEFCVISDLTTVELKPLNEIPYSGMSLKLGMDHI